jgi:hypothetical protein
MQTGTDAGRPLRLLVVGTLLAGALMLWLSASGAGHAATADQTQGMSATVVPTISWGSAGSCTQSMGTADFGTVTPGVLKTTAAIFTGCVSSSSPYGVSVVGTTPMTSGANTIPLANVDIYQQFTSWAPSTGSRCTTVGACPLNVSQSLFTAAPAATGRAVSYNFGTTPPTTQAAGTYTGGLVTFTASN